MIKILRTAIFILAPIGLLFLIGFSGKDNRDNSNFSMESFPPNNTKRFVVASEIGELRENSTFKDINLFSSNGDAVSDPELSKFASKVTKLTIDNNALASLLSEKPETISFNIPVGDGNVQLELMKVDIFDKDFRLTSINNGVVKRETFTPGLHYRGIVKGDEGSLASISIFPESVMGVVSDANGNYNLGSIKDEQGNLTSEYIYYNDRDLLKKNDFECGVEGKEDKMRLYPENSTPMPGNLNNNFDGTDAVTDTTIRVFFLCDYKMYQDNGNNLNATANFVQGMYNNVITIYQNESIKTNISEIRVYTSQDPYTSTNSETILTSFGENTQDNFYGDLAHLLSTRNDGLGGIAWIDVLCIPYQPNFMAGRFAYSNIENNYMIFPIHSWTVNVVAHEMGHNLGSNHTHACAWPTGPGGSIGAIDSCYFAEGNCFSGKRPNFNGTIMSYCHLEGAVNFIAGFGPFPGDTIRSRYQNAPCLRFTTNSSEAQAFTLDQNFPNPFNPGTTIRFEIPFYSNVTLSIFDISGREISRLVNGESFNTGVFSYYFDAGSLDLASGVYFYRLIATDPSSINSKNAYTSVKKMILIK